ncbi:hypothetical protein LTR85_006218 [Meristemomyces frigidus]|nr:hypothetical protein LTR85_006218 [Meristemomyces frigidus]
MSVGSVSLCEGEKALGEPLSPSTPSTLVGSVSQDTEAGSPSAIKRSWLSRLVSRRSSIGARSDSNSSSPPPKKDHYTTVTTCLDESPGGYSQVATFQSSDPNFLQYRGFSYLHCRVLLSLQHEVERLEHQLDELDRWDKGHDGERKLESKSKDESRSPADLARGFYEPHMKKTRPTILHELKGKLLEYDELLLKTKEMASLHRPTKRDYESVRSFFRDKEPIVRPEAQFIRRREDIVTLRTGRESAGFDGFVEVGLGKLDRFLSKSFGSRVVQNVFLTPELRAKCKDGDVDYYAPSRINALVNIIITIVIFILLIMPVVIMYEVTNLGQRQSALDAIGVLIVFTLIFGMAISSLTTAKRQELFGASAAYCAVLVVFIGNFGVQQVAIMQQ